MDTQKSGSKPGKDSLAWNLRTPHLTQRKSSQNLHKTLPLSPSEREERLSDKG